MEEIRNKFIVPAVEDDVNQLLVVFRVKEFC